MYACYVNLPFNIRGGGTKVSVIILIRNRSREGFGKECGAVLSIKQIFSSVELVSGNAKSWQTSPPVHVCEYAVRQGNVWW